MKVNAQNTFLFQNLDNLLGDCDNQIVAYRGLKSNHISMSNKTTSFSNSHDETLISSQLSTTDIALSMIDVDKLVVS